MSCFFDSIFRRLTTEQKKAVGKSSASLPRYFAGRNRETPLVRCNGIGLNKQQLKENVSHVKALAGHDVRTGYLTSFYEPYFYLCCELFRVNIVFKYRGHIARFTREGNTLNWSFAASSSHIN
jgi:hypothetical protein